MKRVLLVCLVVLSSCAIDNTASYVCETDGQIKDGRRCDDGIWVPVDADDGGTQGDAPDGGCTPETDATFCSRLGLDCDLVTTDDNCAVPRTVNCGACADPQSCGGGGDANVCGCESESTSEFCTGLVKNCDDVTADDNCGIERTENCGSCTAPATCGGGGTANVCACSAQTDIAFCQSYNAECGVLSETDACGQTRTVD